MRKFKKGEFVVEGPNGKPVMIVKIERRIAKQPNLDRFTVQDVNGTRYGNIPAYGLRDATEAEVKGALEQAGKL